MKEAENTSPDNMSEPDGFSQNKTQRQFFWDKDGVLVEVVGEDYHDAFAAALADKPSPDDPAVAGLARAVRRKRIFDATFVID